MSTALASQNHPQVDFSAGRLFEPSGSTLEDLILGAWEDLVANGRAECPSCGGDMHPVGCTDCGSRLS